MYPNDSINLLVEYLIYGRQHNNPLHIFYGNGSHACHCCNYARNFAFVVTCGSIEIAVMVTVSLLYLRFLSSLSASSLLFLNVFNSAFSL